MNSDNNNGDWDIGSSSEDEIDHVNIYTRQREETTWYRNFSNEEYGADWPEHLRAKNSNENGYAGESSTQNHDSHSEARSSTENQSALDTSVNDNFLVVKVAGRMHLIRVAHADSLQNTSSLVREFISFN